MDSVEGEDDHHDEIWNQQRNVEGVPAIDVAEGVVRVMRFPIVAEPALRAEKEREGLEKCGQSRLPEVVQAVTSILREHRALVPVLVVWDIPL
jgi:hypothetical protein